MIQNKLLGALAPDDLDALRPHLTQVELPSGATVAFPGLGSAIHFVETGFLSIILPVGSLDTEMGLVGREGMLGVPAALGADTIPYRAIVRHPGYALTMPVDAFRRVAATRPAIGALVLKFVQAEVAQLAYTSFANAYLSVPGRLARWLLMAHDRIDGETLTLTHDVLSFGLGVQRPRVTVSLHDLEGGHMIRSDRGRLTIRDRSKLEAFVGDCYGPAEAAYALLIGSRLRKCAPERQAV